MPKSDPKRKSSGKGKRGIAYPCHCFYVWDRFRHLARIGKYVECLNLSVRIGETNARMRCDKSILIVF